MSFTHIATQSIPTVSYLFVSNATFNFVPTPSVPDTKIGFLYSPNLYKAPKLPNSFITFLL